ncbi:unnamed protein product [Chrysoparadoxa australica]
MSGSTNQDVSVIVADYDDPEQAQHVVDMLSAYAQDKMGGGEDLPQHVKDNLVTALKASQGAFTVLAYTNGHPIGLCNCLASFSTFACKPVINVHDCAVIEGNRGKGVAGLMMERVKEVAKERGCCKVTLEVLVGNDPAKAAYTKAGFKPYVLHEKYGVAEFWHVYT